MKKSLLLVALLSTFGVASAQTSVTVYGTVDAGVAYINGADFDGRMVNLESGQQSYSRLGFRGTEDLGSGMKALFVLEQGILINTGDSRLDTLGSNIPFEGNSGTFSSQAYLGLSNNYAGTLTLGRQFSPLYEAYGVIDPFQNGFAANINNFFGIDEFNVSNYQRMNNALIYKTPDNLYGLKGTAAYGFGEVAGSTVAQSQIGASLGYINGPLNIVYAYHQANNDEGINLLGLNNTFKTHFIGATFDFGVAKIHAAFDQNKRADTFKTQDYMAGVTVPFGPNTLFADYTHKKVKTSVFLNSDDASQYAVGYTYALSKRTNLYSAYTHVRNDANSYIDTEIGGNSVNIFQVGVRHLF